MFKKWDNEDAYRIQTQVLNEALDTEDHALDVLIRRMREEGPIASAIYLAGGRIDNDHCFGSKDLGMLVSVLPEDGAKAAKPGYHPGSTEVYVIFQGSLVLESIQQNELHADALGQYEVRVIPPGQCHRVRHEPNREAASFIVKTNLHHKPGVVRCEDCSYYENKTDCSLWRSWKQETSMLEASE